MSEEQRLDGAVCRYCGGDDIRIAWRLEAKPIGSFSLSGFQMKFSTQEHPYAICQGCGHASRGEKEEAAQS